MSERDGFLISYSIKQSKYGGLGVFAEEFVAEGTSIWEQTSGNAVKISRELYRNLCDSELAKSPLSMKLFQAIASYSCYENYGDCLCLILDNGRFVNHAAEPNSVYFDGVSIASRNIYPGEEILEDYNTYDRYPWPEPWDPFPGAEDLDAIEEYKKSHPENPCSETFLCKYKCFVADTGDRGLGLFLGVDVKEGDAIWEANIENSLFLTQENWKVFTASHLDDSYLSQGFYDACMMYGFYMGSFDSMLICFDNARFLNHSLDPNLADFETMNIFRYDLESRVELIDDYSKYDRCPWAMFAWTDVLENHLM